MQVAMCNDIPMVIILHCNLQCTGTTIPSLEEISKYGHKLVFSLCGHI